MAELHDTVAGLEATLQVALTAIADIQSNNALALGPYVLVQEEEVNGLLGPHVIFEGANIHVRSGSGTTDDGQLADPNAVLTGLGNVIVGYNEAGFPFGSFGTRSGSHNLVVGPSHGYTSFGGFVAGANNGISAPNSSVAGGSANRASGERSSVSGGLLNSASGENSSILGGRSNDAIGGSSAVVAGRNNAAKGSNAVVVGGTSNTAGGGNSWVGGGEVNRAEASRSAVAGGNHNIAAGTGSIVIGGQLNSTSVAFDVVP